MGYFKAIRILLILCAGLFLWVSPAAALLKATTVLLPSEDVSEPARPDNMLRVAADGSAPIKLVSTARLRFDLQSIPAAADITGVTLRVEGQAVQENQADVNPQMVRIFTNKEGQGGSIGSWFAKGGDTVFTATSDAMRRSVVAARKAGQTLTLWLRSKSRLSDWHYFSTQFYGTDTASQPRLIIEFSLDLPTVAPPERTGWRFCKATSHFKAKPFAGGYGMLSNPVFYNGNVFFFAKPDADHTALFALHFNGNERWRRDIEDPPAQYARVGYEGTLYSIGRQRVARYNLNQNGLPGERTTIAGLKLALPPALGTDGSLYFTHEGYAYGLNALMQELWRYPQKGTGSAFSPIVLAPPAQQRAYIVARVNNQNYLTPLNCAFGRLTDLPFANKYTDFHTPVVIAGDGATSDYVYLAANSQSDGVLACYSGEEQIWSAPGPVSQPVATADGRRLVAVQNGKLKVFDRLNGRTMAVSTRDNLAATSNPVLDGDDNVYFWNNGIFYGFDKTCKLLTAQQLPGLAERLALEFAPDGTLYARNLKTRQLTLILPTLNKLTVKPDNLQTDTIYSADTVRIAPNLTLSRNINIALKARDRISIGRGFTVKKGARLTCKTGY